MTNQSSSPERGLNSGGYSREHKDENKSFGGYTCVFPNMVIVPKNNEFDRLGRVSTKKSFYKIKTLYG